MAWSMIETPKTLARLKSKLSLAQSMIKTEKMTIFGISTISSTPQSEARIYRRAGHNIDPSALDTFSDSYRLITINAYAFRPLIQKRTEVPQSLN